MVGVRSDRPFEDVSQLSEEELRERVRKSIEELVPQDAADAAGLGDGAGDQLTPAQVFYMENRERLVSRAQDYYLEKQRELISRKDGVPEDVEDEWRFYHDPVLRPQKGHLWSTGEEEDGDEHGSEHGWLELTSAWPQGQLPTAEMLAELLRSEQARDVRVVDLHECGRHDVGTHGIVATGVTTRHSRRLGDIASKATQACKAPYIEAFCFGTRNDEWVVAHCGPIKVHIFTRESRDLYQLDVLWENPEQFFSPGDFPHYQEVYGTAGEAFTLHGAHITDPSGSRSTSYIAPPYRDDAHDAILRPDYDAADDIRYTVPMPVMDVGAAERPGRRNSERASYAPEEDTVFGSGTTAGDETDTDDESVSEGFAAEAPSAKR